MPESFGWKLRFADRTVSCAFQFPHTIHFFRGYLAGPAGDEDLLRLSEDNQMVRRSCYPEEHWTAYAEYRAFLPRIADELLRFDLIFVHSVAFVWHDRAWLLCAPSGTGKTTQYLNLKKLYGDEVQILCGDNPMLQFLEDRILVLPSPWNGKENYHSSLSAPLGGLILLEQAKENRMERISPREAAAKVFVSINSYCEGEDSVRAIARLEERLLNSTPLWRLDNLGDLASSELLMENLQRCEEGSI